MVSVIFHVPACFPSICPLLLTLTTPTLLLVRSIESVVALMFSKKVGVMFAIRFAVGLVPVLVIVNVVTPVKVTHKVPEVYPPTTPAFTLFELSVVGSILITVPLLAPRYSTTEFLVRSALFPFLVKYCVFIFTVLKSTL
jgi:hypothetical protein